ncbi:IS6 family transposase [Silvanigrella paludirubra]|uniref:IS6 family transposase n=1 Tax=Silvanigrella paludirubra TaxID=2499159 RepID=A0A6N6VR19_9BACT|nr:IS6 family transposase [Silvanigrella paludirubra]KAB8038029.1 IS6 family transposase [Silvanigrella paludirubra]
MDFKWKQTERMIIIMAVRWYLAYSLSYRQVEELLEERGIYVDHTTIHRWVVEYSSKLLKKFHECKKKIHKSWRMDETNIKVKGKWHYLFRAVDKLGQTIDIYLSKRRDTASAKLFFQRVFRSSGVPEKVNIDKSGSKFIKYFIKVVQAISIKRDNSNLSKIKEISILKHFSSKNNPLSENTIIFQANRYLEFKQNPNHLTEYLYVFICKIN